MSETPHALGGKILTRPFMLLALLACIGAYFVVARLLFGLGAVTNLSGGYPWGIWIGLDDVVGTALGCGGLSLALLVYIFNRNRYHPLMRPALMASLFGYTLAGAAVILDLGRYWHAHHLMLPWYAQPNSALLQVALCMGAYVVVLWIAFSPPLLERFGRPELAKTIKKYMWLLAAFGVLLPIMHQSSLGSMLLVMGSQLSPLWYTNWLPLLFLVTAIAMGYGVVMLESTLVTKAFHLPSEQRILGKLSPVIAVLLALFLVIRLVDIVKSGHSALMFAGDRAGTLFAIEMALFLVATVLFATPQARRSQRLMFLAAVSILVAGAFYRLNAYLIAYDPVGDWVYFPAVGELMITIGIFSLELMLYLIFIKKLPVLSGARSVPTGQEA
jgi:Ni/Fe-hydrogenase subunit HybB-like protein